jgi:hypothetical protein
MTLKNQIAAIIWRVQIRDIDGAQQGAEQVMECIKQHLAQKEAAERYLYEHYGEPDDWEPAYTYAESEYQLINNSLIAAVGE